MIHYFRKRLLLTIPVLLIFMSATGSVLNSPCTGVWYQETDSIERQVLYNGRAWRNLYSKIKGDQFLFSGDFHNGSVTIGNHAYDVSKLKYDIYNDELILVNDKGIVIQMNKEITDRFSLSFPDKKYDFKRLTDSTSGLAGYVRVLYEGDVSFFVKYKKNIMALAVDNKYDLFDQSQKFYLETRDGIFLVKRKNSFFRVLGDHKQAVKSYMRTSRLRISKQEAESFVPAVKYFDKLLHQVK
jgi:hypothetical protein